jgi:hypothetical protein
MEDDIEEFDEAPAAKAQGKRKKAPSKPVAAAPRKKTKAPTGEPKLEFGSGKSAARHFLKTFFGSLVFPDESQGRPDTRTLHRREHVAHIALEDSLQQLQLFKLHPSGRQRDLLAKQAEAEADGDYSRSAQVEPIQMPLDLVRMMKKNAEYTLNKRGGGTQYSTYVMCFDRAEDVPITKREEQADRDATVVQRMRDQEAEAEAMDIDGGGLPGAALAGTTKVVERSQLPHAEQRPYLRLHEGFHCEWDEAMTDRLGTREEILRNLCSHMLDVYETHDECDALRAAGARSPLGVGFRLDKGKRVILAGHCLRRADLQELDMQLRLAQSQQLLGGERALGADLSDEEIHKTPVCLECDALTGFYRLYLMPTCMGRLGETDFMGFHIFESLRRLTASQQECAGGLDLFTTDTDLLHLSLVYLWKLAELERVPIAELPPICIAYQAQTWVLRRNSPWSAKEPWVDVLSLFKHVHAHGIRHAQSLFGVINLCAAAFCGGGDYMFSLPGIPVFWWMAALWHHVDYVGNLLPPVSLLGWEKPFETPPPASCTVEPAAYDRLLRAAYLLAHSTLFADDEDSQGAKASKPNRRALLAGVSDDPEVVLGQKRPSGSPRRVVMLNPARWKRQRIEEATEHYTGETFLFPSEETADLRRAQLSYYLNMVLQVGNPELHLPDPCEHGYKETEVETPLRASQSQGSQPLSQTSSSRTQNTRIYAKIR